MKIVSYMHARRTWGVVTGVGKHINNMIAGLAATPGIDVSLLTARDQLADGKPDPRSPLAHVPTAVVPAGTRNAEWRWILAGSPPAETYAPGADWYYCPADSVLPSRTGRVAVTSHCVNWLEPGLPWFGEWANYKARLRWRLFFRAVRRDATIVLAVSEFLKGRLVDLVGVPAERIAVVGNGVEPAYYAAEPTDPTPAGIAALEPYLVVVGGLTMRKGGDTVLATARALHERGSPLRVVVIGKSEPRFAAEAKSLPNVVEWGYLGVADGLPAVFARAVALLFPSRYETFGIPTVEAMAAGTPAIIADLAALPEVAGDAGIVVNPNDPAGIADRADHLVRDAADRAAWIDRGRRRAEQFRWERCVERLLTAMRQ